MLRRQIRWLSLAVACNGAPLEAVLEDAASQVAEKYGKGFVLTLASSFKQLKQIDEPAHGGICFVPED